MEKVYWATKDGEDLAAEMKRRVEDYDNFLFTIGRYRRLAMSYRYFYNQLPGAAGISKDGDGGEILRVACGGYRSYINNIHILVTQAQAAYEAEASNGDIKSKSDAIVGRQTVEHYFDRDEIDTKQVKSVLNAILFGEDFVELPWNDHLGEEVGVEDLENPESRKRSGDLCARTHSTMNVIRDINLKSHESVPWYIVRYWRDRWELAAENPEHADFILNVSSDMAKQTWFDIMYEGINTANKSGTQNDQIVCYQLWHEDTMACKKGRDVLMIGDRIITSDPLTDRYKKVPLGRMSAGDIDQSFLPYSSAWDLLTLFQAKNALATARISNAINMAMSTIWSADPETDLRQLRTAFSLITSTSKPEALNLANSSPAINEADNWIEQMAQATSGLNQVARGSNEAIAGDKSGAAYALLLSQAIQFQSDLQNRYKRFAGINASNVIMVLQRNGPEDMMIRIAGKSRTTLVREFKKERLDGIERVRMRLANPLLQTTAGKLTVADSIQSRYKEGVTLRQYCELIETGNLDVVLGPYADMNMTMGAENEVLFEGGVVPVILFEHHLDHIKAHLQIASTPEQKKDPMVISAMNAHIQEHLKNWMILTQTNPQMLQVLGLPPLLAPPPQPGMTPGASPDSQPGGAPKPAIAPPSGVSGPGLEGKMPNMPSLPGGSPASAASNYAQAKAGAIQ